jgi:Kelch motif
VRLMAVVALAAALLAGCGGGGDDALPRRDAANGWRFTTPMANRRSYVAASKLGGRIYVAGGMVGDSGRHLDRFQVFDPARTTWTTLPRLPEPVRAGAGAALQGAVFVLGGTTPTGGGRQVYSYEPGLRRWSRGDPLPRVLYNHAAVATGDRIYVLGGYDTRGKELRTVYWAGPHVRGWRTAPPLPRPMHAFGAVVFRGEIWVLGGRRGEERLRDVWIFDLAKNRWRRGPTMPKPMELLGATVVGDQIHAVWEHTYQIYDASEGRWHQGPAPLVARHALSLFAIGGSLYAVGGCTTKLRDTAVVEQLRLTPTA